MLSSLLDSIQRRRRDAAGRLVLAACAAIGLLAAASGCEYFTSERLEKLAPGDPADPLSKLGPDPLAPLASETGPLVDDDPHRLTAAEVVAMLERIIRGNQAELDGLSSKLEDREEEAQARDVFQHLDDLVKSIEQERKKAAAEGQEPRVQELARQAANLKKPWDLARERLNLDLRERMLSLERVEILQDVLAHDRDRLAAVLSTGDMARIVDETRTSTPTATPEQLPTTADQAGPPTPAPATPPATPPAVQVPIIPGQPLIPKAVDPKDAAKDEAGKSKDEAKAKGESETVEGKAEGEAEKSDAQEKPKLPPSKELLSAKQELQVKSTAVQKLQERTMSLDSRMRSLARSLELVRELALVARRSVDNAAQTREYLVAEMQEGKPSAALQAWTHDDGDALSALDRRIRTASEDAKRLQSRFEDMVEERAVVVDALEKTSLRAQSAREGLEKTQETVEALQSPWSSHNIRAWFLYHGPPMVATVVLMTLLYVLVSRYAHKLVEIFASRGLRGSKAERDNRMDTLVSVLQNTGSAVVLLGGGSTLLSQAGVPVTPLLGGAAVAGVAVAFGAQNLIKDFFYGFMILLENQYKLKDIVKIGDHSGQVEQITLRMTALRDGDGGLHFLPNGATTSVVNLTHGWSSASFNVRISWEEDVDRVITIIQDLGKELRQDPSMRLMIVDDLNMMGVDALTDSAVVILFSIKTLPLQQWSVKREFLRRLKKKFMEKKVMLPPPPTLSPPQT